MFTGVRLKEKSRKLFKTFRGVSHEHRLAILYLLAHGDMEERDIVANIDLPQNLVAHHLKILFEAGWVTKIKVGKNVTFKLRGKTVKILDKLFQDSPFARNYLAKYR